jgi:predicted dehydrogenase
MDSFTRRTFLGTASAMAARSYAQVKGANERLRIGVIGCGGMSTHHMKSLVKVREQDNLEFLNVCDIYDKRAEAAAQLTGGKAVKDYRRLLENKDIDYVLIATPEHWHYQMTMDAADAGKHIYCEKPMTHTVEQSKKVVEKIQHAGVKMQVGVQGMSDDSYEEAQKYVKDGTLGKVVIAQIDYSRNHKTSEGMWAYPIDADAKPGVNLDWKAWLGPAQKRDWDPLRYFRWRNFWDYSGGISTDLFIHRVTRIIRALDLKFPERGVGVGGTYEFLDPKAEVPETFNVMLEYPGGPQVILVSSMANDTPVDHVLRGHKATLTFTKTGFTIKPQGLFAKEGEGKEIAYQKHGAEEVTLHHRNLQAAIRRNEPLKCDCMMGYYGVVACEMGVQSFRHRQYMKWDAAKERIVRA